MLRPRRTIFRHAVGSVAVAAAMALVASTVPASASTAPASAHAGASGGTVAAPRQPLPLQEFQPKPGQSVRVTVNGQVVPAHGSVRYPLFFVCLYNATGSCLGVPTSSKRDDAKAIDPHVVMDVAHVLFIIWELVHGNKDDNDGTPGGPDPAQGLCLAATGLDQQLTQTPCTATHGNYWQYQTAIKGNDVAYRLWNTEYHCFMTTHATTAGTWAQCSNIKQEPWSTWGNYQAS